METTCVSTVRTLMNSAVAASRLVAPLAIWSATRCSAGVSSAPDRLAAVRRQFVFELGQQRPVPHLGRQVQRPPQGGTGLAAGLPPPLDPA